MSTVLIPSHRLTAPVAIAGATAAVCVGVALADPTTPGGVIPVCPSKALFGIICPGCGSSRMLYSLLHGDIPAAVHFNALGILALAVLAYTYVVWTRNRLRDHTGIMWHQRHYAPHITLVLVLAWLTIRNIPLEPFTALRV